ncbi:MAG: SBBP repeat-containing protein [Candidatus Rokubacteria bacterium]|nr:SBBP repeat-containing protein [Candidatus Rokubacteria bacterium]
MASCCRVLSIGVLTVLLASPTSPLSVAPGAIRPAAATPTAATNAPRPGPPPSLRALAGLPLHFEPNHGQSDGSVRFLARAPGYTLFLTPTEAVIVTAPPRSAGRPGHDRRRRADLTRDARPSPDQRSTAEAVRDATPAGPAVIRMKLVGANPDPLVSGVDQLPGRVNYFLGNDPAQWRTNIPTYARVRYRQVYPGVDLVYDGQKRQMEFDFVVAPGADPGRIRLAFEGTGRVALDSRGDLLLSTAAGELRLQKPHLYQEIAGRCVAVDGGFALSREARDGAASTAGRVLVGVRVATYDRSTPLVVDPVLAYSTYLGTSVDDQGSGIAVDGSGNAYVTGETLSTNFPTASAVQPASGGGTDAFVTKLDPTGATLVYSTYLGGSSTDGSFAIAVDGSGNAYVTGETLSTNFPTASAAQPALGGFGDAFIARISEAGADLALAMTDAPDPVTVGASLTYYTLTVTNGGPSTATGVTLTDPLPAGLTFASATPSQGTCSGTTTVSCALGSLSNGASATVTLVVTPTVAGGLTNTASVTATETDASTANNTASATTTITAPPPPTAPSGLTATLASPTQVTLAWTDQSTDETDFELERDTDGTGLFALLTTVPAATGTGTRTFADTTVVLNRTYTYRVRAVNGASASGYSNTAAVTVQAGRLVVLPPRLTFSGVSAGSSDTKTVTLQNAGQGTLTGSVSGTLSAPFTLLAGGGTFSLAPGATLAVTVQFSPSARGTARSALTVTSDDPARPATRVQVTGIVR